MYDGSRCFCAYASAGDSLPNPAEASALSAR